MTGRQTAPLSYELHLILILTGLHLNIPHYQHSAPSAPLSIHFKNLKKHPGCNIQLSHNSSFQLCFISESIGANTVSFQCSLHPACVLRQGAPSLQAPLCAQHCHRSVVKDSSNINRHIRSTRTPVMQSAHHERRRWLGKWVAVTNKARDSQSLNVVWILIKLQTRVGYFLFFLF